MWMFSGSRRTSSCDWTDSVLEMRLDLSRRLLEHVQEVGVAAGVELVGALEGDAAVAEQCAPATRCTIVAPTWLLMSSPTSGRLRWRKLGGELRMRRR